MNRGEMVATVRAALDAAGDLDATAVLRESRQAAVRFGQNRLTQNVDVFRRELELTLGRDGRKATATTHCIEPESLPVLVERIREQLITAPEDPEYMPPVKAGQVYPVIESWDQETAGMATDVRMAAAALAIDTAARSGMEAAGIAESTMSKVVLGTSTGNLASHRRTGAELGLTMDAGDGSSYRCETSEAWANLDVEAAVGGVAREAAASTGPKGAASGRTSVLLEPQAVADLLPFLIFSLNARSADEGVTVFSGMEGRRVSGPSLTMRSLLAGSVPGRPFDGEGLPCRDALWIEKGVLREMICDRFWAGKTGRPPLSSPQCYYMDGGEGGVEEGLGLMDRGILIRRLWYIRFVDQRSLEITGMTRDGVFAVEGGRIVEPLKDFRWNWLPLSLFRRIAWLGRPVRKGRLHVPPMVLEDVKTD